MAKHVSFRDMRPNLLLRILVTAALLRLLSGRCSGEPSFTPADTADPAVATANQALADLQRARDFGTLTEAEYHAKRTKLRVQAWQAETKQVRALWKAKQYGEAVQILRQRAISDDFASADRGYRSGVYYDLACGSSLLRRPAEALAYLGMAVGEGFHDYAHLKADPDLYSLRDDPTYTVLLETVRQRGDYPWILRRHADYISEPPKTMPAFTYQPATDPDLTRLRESYQLESIAGNGDDVSRALNLLHWVHVQVRHDGICSNPSPYDSLNFLQVSRKENRGLNCRMMATILNDACLALGFNARSITCLSLDDHDPDCHVINAVWLASLKKWAYLDPTYEAYFTDAKGQLLSVGEVRAALTAGEPLALCPQANWNGRKKPPEEYLLYMSKNLVRLQCPEASAFGYESGNRKTSYVELVPVNADSTGPRALCLRNPAAFWAAP